MPNNIISAISHIATSQILNLPTIDNNDSTNRINLVGDPLEAYVKDAFANILGETNINTRLRKYSEVFSWTGNTNNPPDFMMYGGDAVEVKKISSPRSSIQLNSSYPKLRLFSSDPMITQACRECENWMEKDLIYTIGHVSNHRIHSLWIVYGDCFVAKSDVYSRITKAIEEGILQSGVQLNKTNELARVNKVDPLGITSLRVRGMWIIANPATVFKDLIPKSSTPRTINVIMSENKFYSFPEDDRKMLNKLPQNIYAIHKIKTPSPDNPAELQDTVYIGLTI